MSDGTVAVAGTNHTMPIVSCPSCGKRNRVPVVASGTPRCASCHHDLPWVVDAGSAEFDEATRSRLPVLVDLWAPWCGPCRLIAPVIDELASEMGGRVRFAKLNVDENPATAARFRVSGIPTLLILRGGREVDRIVGVQPKAAIARRLESLAV